MKVSIKKHQYLLEGQSIELDALVSRIEQADGEELLLCIENQALTLRVVPVMDAAKRAKLSGVSFSSVETCD